MKFYKECCLLYIVAGVLSKLILSNTIEAISYLDILDDQVNLTIWIQIRLPFFLMIDEAKLVALRITDQNNQDQLLITIDSPDKQKIIIEYELQNQIRDRQSLQINYDMVNFFQWIEINSQRNICFERLYNNKINMRIKCNQQFNATLYTFRQNEFLILIYDQMEFLNQEIIIQDFPIIQNLFSFNIYKNDLKIIFYAKYYSNLEQEGIFYSQMVESKSSLNFIYQRDYIIIQFQMYKSILSYTKLQQKIQHDQWLYCSLSFNVFEVTIQLLINYERIDLTIDVGKYFKNGILTNQLPNYFFSNNINVLNSQTIIWNNLLIINNIEKKTNLIDQDFFCIRDCQNCGEFLCNDDSKFQSPSFIISKEVELSNYYLNIFPNYQENVCTDKKFYLKDKKCVEWPKYYGQYCINCQFQQKKLTLNYQILDVILDPSYHYYLDNHMPEDFKQIPIGLILQQDLNIFIFQIKDIYLIYKIDTKFYCEDEYFYKSIKCVKQLKKCLSQQKDCNLCSQFYSLLNKKCIRCQKHCLNCMVINKKIYCVLYINDYYQNNFGLLKECNQYQKEVECEGREQIIQNLTLIGHNLCQLTSQYSFYFVKEKQNCQRINFANFQEQLKNYKNKFKIYDQKLEVQDMIVLQNKYKLEIDEQIYNLINYQQINKLSYLADQFQKNFIYQQRQQNFMYLSKTKQTKDNINQNKFVFYNVKYILTIKGAMIIYKKQNFQSFTDIYKEAKINFKIIQFDILLIAFGPLNDEVYSLDTDQNLKNISFILNITFKINPSLLANGCIQIQIRANQIIFSNIYFQDFDSKCHYVLFLFLADHILVNNLLIRNSKLNQLFLIENYISLKCNNFMIIDSDMLGIIYTSNRNMSRNPILTINNIYFFQSNVDLIIYIYNVFHFEIGQIYFRDSIIKSFIDIDNFEHSAIYDIIYYNVTLQNIQNINIKCQQLKSDITIKNIAIYNTTFTQSYFLFLSNLRQIQISQLYLDQVFFNLANFIVVSTFQKICIQTLYFKTILLNQTQVFAIADGISFLLKDSYQWKINMIDSTFIISKNNETNITNFNIERIQSTQQSTYILCQGNFCYLHKFKINNYSIYNTRLIQIAITPLQQSIIEILIFKNIISRNLFLLYMDSKKVLMNSLFIINSTVINDIQDNQLIQIRDSEEQMIKSVKFQNMIISSLKFQFYLISLKNLTYITIDKLLLNQINGEQSTGKIIFIDSQIHQLQISNLYIQNMFYIQFINSQSTNKLFFYQFNIRNITLLEPFIFHEAILQTPILKVIQISNLNVHDFSGQLIEIFVKEFINVQLINIIIFNYYNSGNLFKFASNNNLVLKMINIIIVNQKNMIQKENIKGIIFLIQAPISIFIYQLYVNQINQQILYINQTKKITVSYLKIYNINSQEQIIQIKQLPYKVIFHLRNIRFINVTSIEAIFDLSESSNLSRIQLTNLVLQNVSSFKSIFYSGISLNLYKLYLLGGTSKLIFQAQDSTIQLRKSLITNINQLSILSDSMLIKIQDSEIVDSKIIYDDTTLTLEQSIILGNYEIQVIIQKMFLSLNNGLSIFDLHQIDENVYQFYFTKNNHKNQQYLYLPSGQNIQNYQYLHYKTQQYDRIYDSLSFVSKYQFQQISCNLTQEYENQIINKYDLIMVPGLNIIKDLVVKLNPFHKDKYIKLDLSCNQNNHIITYRTLIKTFNCQLGEYLYQDQCYICNIDKQYYSVGYNQAHCKYIDSMKIEQLKIGQLKLYSQYWRFSLSNNYIELCETDSCLGGWKTGDSSCKIGYYGAICSECDINNIRGDGNYGKIDDQCKLCHFDRIIYLKALCLLIYQLGIIYTNYYTNKQQSEQYLFIRIAQRKFTEILLRQNVNQATIILKLFYNYLFTLFLLKESIYFGYYINVSLNLIYNPNYIAVSQFDCLIHQLISLPIQYSQLLYKILMPVLIFNIFIIIYILLIKLRTLKHSIYIVIVCLLTIFQQNQYIIIQSLIKLAQRVKYSNIYWTLEYKASQYYSKIHQFYLFTLIIPLIGLFVIINIFIFYQIKIINSRVFNNLKLSSYVYKQYKNKFYYWEYLRIAYIYLIMVTIYSQDFILYIIIFLSIFSLLNNTYKPFVLQNLNKIDIFILQFSIFSYFAILIGKQFNQFHTFVILIISNIILIKILIKYLIHSFKHQYRKIIIKFTVLLIRLIPYLKNFITVQNTDKLNYYYSVLRFASKNSNGSLSAIFPSTLSKSYPLIKSYPYTPVEIELSNLNIK